jgi:hypothetical protein
MNNTIHAEIGVKSSLVINYGQTGCELVKKNYSKDGFAFNTSYDDMS